MKEHIRHYADPMVRDKIVPACNHKLIEEDPDIRLVITNVNCPDCIKVYNTDLYPRMGR